MNIASFSLISATTQAAAPLSLGHAFKKGDVPAGSQVVGSIADLQVVAKNVWPDGSLKFAVISGRASLTSGIPLTVTLSIGTPAAGAALTLVDLKATGVTAAIDAGAFGAASWSGTDWDANWQAWVSGPKMSSWVYRKQIGSDAHLVGFLEVRLFAGGAVEILPWIENGYLKVAGPTNKSATYTFTMGGTQRFSAAVDLKHHARTPLISGAALSHWLGSDPGVTPRHDVAYMQATELVPTYMATRSATGLGLVSSYTPFDKCNFIYDLDSMASGGYQAPIGLLPLHDVAYLVCTDQHELLYGAVVRNGFAAGRYCIHYRDESTVGYRIPAFTTHATLVLNTASSIKDTGASTASNYTPVPTGGYIASWDTAHCPEVGYMAYQVTGHFYHMETTQFAVASSWFNINNNFPDVTVGIRFVSTPGAIQTRTTAWGSRLLFHALAATPDADSVVRGELIALAERVVNYYHATYVAQANNQFGIIKPGESYTSENGDHIGSMWQQDFFTATYGYALSMGLPISSTVSTKLSEFFHWKAKSVVGRLGVQGDFWYINSSPYYFAMAPSPTADYTGGTGPWFASWNEMYQACDAHSNATWFGTTEGVLCSVDSPSDYDAWAKGLMGNMHPAIAYAVRHGAPGADAAYGRLTSASNYPSLATALDTRSGWSIKPASISAPAESAPMGESLNIDTVSRIAGALVIGNTGGGVLGKNLAGPVNGKAGYLYDDIDQVADAEKEICGRITAWPSAGTFIPNENGSYSFADAPDGIYSFSYQLEVDYQPVGPLTTEELVVGGTQATAAWTEGADVVAATATASTAGIAASLGWTEGADVIAVEATASAGVQAFVVWTEGADVIAASAFVVPQPEDVFHVSPSCTVNFDGGTNRVDF